MRKKEGEVPSADWLSNSSGSSCIRPLPDWDIKQLFTQKEGTSGFIFSSPSLPQYPQTHSQRLQESLPEQIIMELKLNPFGPLIALANLSVAVCV